MAGWAEAFMSLRVDDRQVKSDVEKGLKAADGTAAGKRMGTQFGTAMGDESTRRMRDSLGKFTGDAGKAGDSAGRSFAASFAKHLTDLFTGRGGGGGPGAGQLAGRTAGGIGPSILGLSAGRAGLLGLGGAGLGALPALAAGAGALGVAGAGAGVLGAGFSAVQAQLSPIAQAQQKAQQAVATAQTAAQAKAAQQQLAAVNTQIAQLSPAMRSILASENKIQDTWEKFSKSLAPLFAGPLAQVARMFGQLTGPLHQLFSGAAALIQPLIGGLGGLARTVLPLLGQAFRAVAPFIAPLLSGLTQLIGGLLPGLITLLHAAGPAVQVVAGFLGQLGRGLGGMLSAFAPVIQASSKILGALLSVVAGLLPVVGQVAAVFAREMAPAFTAFAGIVQSLLPFLVTVARVVAELASAVLGDLSAAFTAVAGLLRAVGPALAGFARAIGGVFTVLENTGVFAIFGNAIESIIGPLGALISALLRGLTPLLPPLIGFIARLSAMLAAQLGRAVAALLPPLTQLATAALSALAAVLPVILPLLLRFADVFTAATVTAISGVARALAAVINAIPPGVLQAMIIGVAGLVAAIKSIAIVKGAIEAFKGFAVVKGIIDGTTLSMVRFQAQIVVTAVKAAAAWVASTAVIVAQFIAQAAAATAAFIAENLATLGIIAGITALVAAIVYLATHWRQVWGEIRRLAADAGRFLGGLFRNQVVQDILAVWSLGLIPLATHWNQVWAAISRAAVAAWHAIYSSVLAPMISWFTQSLPHGLGVALDHVHGWWSETASAFSGGYHAVYNSTLAPFIRFFDQTIPRLFRDALAATRLWWSGVETTFTNVWNAIYRTTIGAMIRFFTADLPNWTRQGVNAVSREWGRIQDAIRGPVSRVAHHVIIPLFNGIDAVTGFVGLGHPLAGAVGFLGGLAAGGKITQGTTGTADDVLALVSRNETVVSEAHSKILAPVFSMLGIPGYASGGLVNPIGRGLRPERVDMGVDYGGSGPLYALGAGVITSLFNSGWPGGTFLGLRLNPTYGSGYWYYAEDIVPLINRGIRVGAPVQAGQYIADASGGPSGIEVGWAAPPGTGQTAAAAAGQARAGQAHGDPGAYPTAWGVAASNLIASLGGPRGIVRGPVQGGTAGIGGIIRTVEQIFAGLGRFARTAIDIAKGDFGGALGSLLGMFKPGTGGAGGGLGRMLLALPGKLAGDVIRHIVSSVKGFVSGQQAGGLPAVAARGPVQAYARKLVDAVWGDAQWPAFADIVRRESGWDVHATNPLSGAYGIPQALPGSKMASAGADWRTNPYTQIRWMVGYLKSRWHTPAAADANEIAHHWYGQGGWINEPVLGVGRYSRALYGFGESGREYVTPEAQLGQAGPGMAAVAGRLDRVIALLDSGPARTAAGVAQAVTAPQRTLATAARIGAR